MDKRELYLDHNFSVSSFDMDVRGVLKPTTILSICQESAYLHSTLMGFGFDKLLSQNLAWVLSRAHVEIERLPTWHEQIRVRTWHKAQSGLFGLRDYIFFDEQDTPIIRVTTSWLVINRATRRLTRLDRIFNTPEGTSIESYALDAIASEAAKIEPPLDGVSVGDHLVRYSDLDVNNHVNNTRYLEWACDRSPQQMDEEQRLSGFTINFNHEAKFQERVDLTLWSPSLNTTIIAGKVSGRNIFTAALYY